MTKKVKIKVISGGQVGADKIGLEEARKLGFQTGGTAPKGFYTTTGKGFDLTLKDYGLTEISNADTISYQGREKRYGPRTEQNVLKSDLTLLYTIEGKFDSPGSKLTRNLARKHKRPLLDNPTASQISSAVAGLGKSDVTINIAGNREFTNRNVISEGLKAASNPTTTKKIIIGDIWKQEGYKVVSTNLGGVHGRGLAMQAKQQGKITRSNFSFDTSPKNSDVITLAVKGNAPETARVKGQSFSEQTVGRNVQLLDSEVNKLINFARKNPTKKINLPFIGLGFGEGKTEEITPILQRASREPNIHLISKDQSTVERYKSSFAPGVRSDSTSRTTASVKPPSSGFTPSKKPGGHYIEIKGPFHIPDPKAAAKIKAEIKRLAKEHPHAEFILREVHASKKRVESVFSAAFKGLVDIKQARRAKEVKLDYNPRRAKALETPVQVREKTIKSLNPFKEVEFTFSGDVASEEWKKWRSVDINLSKEMEWNPLKSKGQHFQSFEGYNKDAYLVKKYKGGTTSASKKIDALIDRISEYGRKKGAKAASVDAGIQYLRDKSAQFEAKQRLDSPKKSPIAMITPERETRLQRLQKNYGTPPKLKGKVDLIPQSEKKIQPQVDVGDTVPILKKTPTTTHLFTTQKHAGHIPTGKKQTYFTDASVKKPFPPPKKPSRKGLKEGVKAGLKVDDSGIIGDTKEFRLNLPEGSTVVTTRHEQIIKGVQTIQTGTEKLEQVKSIREGKGPAYPEGVDPEKKGQVKTGLRVDVTDNTPVGITLRENSGRDFDVSSVHSQKGDPDRGLWPEPSGQRETGISSSTGALKGTVITAPAQQSIEGKVYDPKTTQFPDKQSKTKRVKLSKTQRDEHIKSGLKVPDRPSLTIVHKKSKKGDQYTYAIVKRQTPIVHPFGKVKSALTALDELQPAEFGEQEKFASPAEDFKKSHVEVELGDDVGGGGKTVEVHTESHLQKQAKGLADELAVQAYYDEHGKWPKGTLPPSALANRPWIKKVKMDRGSDKITEIVTPMVDEKMTISDVLHGDSADYVKEGPQKGTRRTSATITHVKEGLTPRIFAGDPTYRGRRKPLTTEQKARAERLHAEDLKGDTTKVVLGKDKLGRPTETLITKYPPGEINPVTHTRESMPITEQLEREGVFRKRREGKSKPELAKQEHIAKTQQELKTTDLIETEVKGNVTPEGKPKDVRQKIYTQNQNKLSLIRQRQKPGQDISKEVSAVQTQIKESLKTPKRDTFIIEDSEGKKHTIQGDISFSGKEHGPMTMLTSKKAKATTLTASQRIRGAFSKAKPITKAVLPPLVGIGALALSPYFAKLQLEAKEKPLTWSNWLQETGAVFMAAPTVYSGVGEKPGYFQNLAKYDITALRENAKTTGDYKPIKDAGGPDTPYAKIKAWMFTKPKTTLPYKSDMATKSNRLGY